MIILGQHIRPLTYLQIYRKGDFELLEAASHFNTHLAEFDWDILSNKWATMKILFEVVKVPLELSISVQVF